MARVQRASEEASRHLLAARRSKAQNGMLHVLEEDLKREVQLTQTRFDCINSISLIIFGLQIMSLRHYKVSKTIILTTLPGYAVSVYAVNIPDLHRRKLLKLSLSRWADTNWNKARIKLMPLR